MGLTELSVKRPATIIVFLIVLLALGWIGYTSLGADFLPSINVPVLTVTATYSGASAEEIKKDLIKPIEEAISGISGIDSLQSSAREGYGQILILFTFETDMNTAFLDVQKALESTGPKLPKNADKPVLYKLDLGEMPVLTLSVGGSGAYDELYNEADGIKQKIEKINGVGKVSLLGAQKKRLFIKIDKTALEFYDINVNTILSKLRLENSNLPGGQIENDKTHEFVKVIGEFSSINDVKQLIISTRNGGKVRLSEIATVEMAYPEPEQILQLNGDKSIGINIQKQSDANVVEVVNRVKEELTDILSSLPPNVKVIIADDTTVFIKRALAEIQRNLIEGVITTAIVLFFFLRSFRSSMIVLVSIPTSLISTYFMMYVFDFTLNMMSMMALSLCIGILVDDSIVVLENIKRHLGMGKSPISAAIEGRKEIGMAAVAITLCDVVVFTPVAFMSGMVGEYFKQFGLTVVFAALFSLLVSFTITPMLASRFLKKESLSPDEQPKQSKTKVQKFTLLATQLYKTFLLWSLENRKKVILGVVVLLLCSISLLPLGLIRAELLTQADQSRLMLEISLSPGSTLKQTQQKVLSIEKHLKTVKYVKDYFSTIGKDNDESKASIIVTLLPKDERDLSQSDVAAELRKWGKTLPGIDLVVNEAQTGGPPNSGNKPLQVNILGPESTVLFEIALRVEAAMKAIPGIIDVDNSSRLRENEIRIEVNRELSNELGVNAQDISAILWTALQGSNVGVYRENGSEYDMVVKFKDDQLKSTQDIGTVMIPINNGSPLFLNQLATIRKSDAEQTIKRMDRQDVVKVSANLEGILLGAANEEIEKSLSTLQLPKGYSITYGSSQEQMKTVFSALIKALLASVVLVYFILVILYESFLTPLIRMLALPTALIGSLCILAFTGKSVNMMSLIGLIMLDGLASKNGTLLIDYTHTLMKQKGLTLRDALIEAGTTRLRPIIMTTLTLIVGMMPLALSIGEGAEFKSSMATVIIGGMITSTIFTPILLPVVYTIFDDWKSKFRKKQVTSNS